MLESLFNSEYCKVFNSTYFEKHLRMVASENKLKIVHKEFEVYVILKE